MKKGWQIKRLGDICTLDKVQGIHSQLPYVGMEHIESETARFIGSTEPQSVKSNTFKFSDNHVLYGRLRPYLNKVLAPNFAGHCSTEIFPIRPSENLHKEYLLYWLLMHSTVEQINATSTGARMPRANMDAILEFKLLLPPLPEQQRIIDILDEAFEGIARAKTNAEANLKNASALLESHLQAVFTQGSEGWTESTVEKLGVIRTGKRDANHQDVNGEYPFYTCAVGQFRSSTYAFDGASIILPGNGANVGKVFFYDGKFEAYQRTYVVNNLISTIDPEFLFYCFKAGWASYISNKQFGSATNYIVVGGLKAFPVPTPPLPTQKATVAGIEKLEIETQRLEDIYRRKIAALDELKQALLHQAFSGGL